MTNCADKFLKHSERVGARFAEQNAGTYLQTPSAPHTTSLSMNHFCRGHERTPFLVLKVSRPRLRLSCCPIVYLFNRTSHRIASRLYSAHQLLDLACLSHICLSVACSYAEWRIVEGKSVGGICRRSLTNLSVARRVFRLTWSLEVNISS